MLFQSCTAVAKVIPNCYQESREIACMFGCYIESVISDANQVFLYLLAVLKLLHTYWTFPYCILLYTVHQQRGWKLICLLPCHKLMPSQVFLRGPDNWLSVTLHHMSLLLCLSYKRNLTVVSRICIKSFTKSWKARGKCSGFWPLLEAMIRVCMSFGLVFNCWSNSIFCSF